MPEESPYRLHVAVDRGEGPVYVLLHGINSTGHDWDTVVTAMGFDRRCIAVDELGYGESPHPTDIDYTIDDHVAALRFTLRELGVLDPFTLVGYSMGGPIALRYAADHPDEIGRLVLISAPFFLDPEEIGDAAYAKAVFQTEGSNSILDMITSAGFAHSGVFKTLSSEDKHVIQDFINAQNLKTDWQILQKNMANVIQGSDFPGDLPRVTAPITFMVGEHDAFIVRSQIETLKRRYAPWMEVRVLADLKADHMLLENIPTVIATEIVRNEDRRLAVAMDRGEGDLYVMLHGVENDGSFWNRVGLALSARDRVIALDLLGFGQSPKPLDIPYDVDDQLGSIEETLASLLRDRTEPFTLVGHSLGAIIAARFARLHPDRVKRLVLFSVPVHHADVHPGDGASDRARAKFRENFRQLRERGTRLASRGPVLGVLGRDRLTRFEPSLRSLENAIEVEDVAGDLARAPDIPVTVVYGTKDPFVVPAYVESLAEVREGIEVIKVDAGHDIATQKALEAVGILDPAVEGARAEVLVEKAAKDPKLRPVQTGWRTTFTQDTALVLFRAVMYLALGLGLLFLPPEGDLRLLRFAFVIFIFARSVSAITGVFTTRSIRQEKITSAASGIVGIVLGIFLMVSTQLAATVIYLCAAAYLVFNGIIDLFAWSRTARGSRRRGPLLWEGLAAVLLGLLLVSGSVLVARLVNAAIMVGAIAAGVMLVTYVLVTTRLGKAAEATLE
jgi:pimeloyl-ACP methyl ester carboxylesterase/uncharacterized membrane protein HdeD (DUF308 family)